MRSVDDFLDNTWNRESDSTHFDDAGLLACDKFRPGDTLTTDLDIKPAEISSYGSLHRRGIARLQLNRASLVQRVQRESRPERLFAIAQQFLALVQLKPAKIVRYNLRYVHFDARGKILLSHSVLEFRRP